MNTVFAAPFFFLKNPFSLAQRTSDLCITVVADGILFCPSQFKIIEMIWLNFPFLPSFRHPV